MPDNTNFTPIGSAANQFLADLIKHWTEENAPAAQLESVKQWKQEHPEYF